MVFPVSKGEEGMGGRADYSLSQKHDFLRIPLRYHQWKNIGYVEKIKKTKKSGTYNLVAKNVKFLGFH